MKYLFFITFFISLNVSAQAPEPEIRDLFDRYDRLMAGEKLLSKDIFSQNFLEEFDASELNYKIEKSDYRLQISKGIKTQDLYFVKRIYNNDKSEKNAATFIIVREKNSWRIQGTISDDL